MATEKKNAIRSIYFYFFTAVGLAMFLIGSYQLIRHTTKKAFFPKYYLEYQETRCDFYPPQVAPIDGKATDANVGKTMKEERERCIKNLEQERKSQEILNLSGSLTMILLGGVTFVFHYKKTQAV